MLKIKNTVKRAEGGVWKIVNFRIACACAMFLCLGIAFGYARITAGLSYWWLALLLLFTGLIFYFSDMFVHMRKCAIVALVLWSFFAVGVISFSAHIHMLFLSRFLVDKAICHADCSFFLGVDSFRYNIQHRCRNNQS